MIYPQPHTFNISICTYFSTNEGYCLYIAKLKQFLFLSPAMPHTSHICLITCCYFIPFASEEDKIKFNKLISKAKELSRQGELERALCLCEKAYKIRQSEKLKRKIEKLKVSK